MDFAAMTNQAVAYGISQVESLRVAVRVAQSFYVVGEKKAVAFVPEFLRRVLPFFLLQKRIQTFFAEMPERRVSDVVPNRNSAREFRVQPKIF